MTPTHTYLVVWSGGYEPAQYKACQTDVEAHALADQWADDMEPTDGIDVIRIDLATGDVDVLWQY
jgi:hypothetical protein